MQRAQLLIAAIIGFAPFGIMDMVRFRADDDRNADQQEYEFVQLKSRPVTLIRGDNEIFGKLDVAGTFIPDKKLLPFRRGQAGSRPAGLPINEPAQKGVYEFRSGSLISGDIDDKGNFIPTVGGRIIDFKDYRYSPKAAKIYNLPGKFIRKEKKDGKK